MGLYIFFDHDSDKVFLRLFIQNTIKKNKSNTKNLQNKNYVYKLVCPKIQFFIYPGLKKQLGIINRRMLIKKNNNRKSIPFL
jgi:hypothetical protein